MVGHFPVYFQSKDQETFTVDKVEQAKVLEQVTLDYCHMTVYICIGYFEKKCWCFFPTICLLTGKISQASFDGSVTVLVLRDLDDIDGDIPKLITRILLPLSKQLPSR